MKILNITSLYKDQKRKLWVRKGSTNDNLLKYFINWLLNNKIEGSPFSGVKIDQFLTFKLIMERLIMLPSILINWCSMPRKEAYHQEDYFNAITSMDALKNEFKD